MSDKDVSDLMQRALDPDTEKLVQGALREKTTMMERHIQTFIGAIMIGLTVWIGSSVTNSRESIAELRVESNGLREKINEMRLDIKAMVTDRISRSEVQRLASDYEGQLDKLEKRVRDLESKLRSND